MRTVSRGLVWVALFGAGVGLGAVGGPVHAPGVGPPVERPLAPLPPRAPEPLYGSMHYPSWLWTGLTVDVAATPDGRVDVVLEGPVATLSPRQDPLEVLDGVVWGPAVADVREVRAPVRDGDAVRARWSLRLAPEAMGHLGWIFVEEASPRATGASYRMGSASLGQVGWTLPQLPLEPPPTAGLWPVARHGPLRVDGDPVVSWRAADGTRPRPDPEARWAQLAGTPPAELWGWAGHDVPWAIVEPPLVGPSGTPHAVDAMVRVELERTRRHCTRRGRESEPATMTLRFRLDPNGAWPTVVGIDGLDDQPELRACVAKGVGDWPVPARGWGVFTYTVQILDAPSPLQVRMRTGGLRAPARPAAPAR